MQSIKIFDHYLADLFFASDVNFYEECWKDTTFNATDEEYMAYQIQKLEITSNYDVHFFLCDTKKLLYVIAPEMQTWTDKLVLDFWNKSNLKRLAFLVSDSLFEQIAIKQLMEESTHKFQIQYFDKREDAVAWLLSI